MTFMFSKSCFSSYYSKLCLQPVYNTRTKIKIILSLRGTSLSFHFHFLSYYYSRPSCFTRMPM